MKRITALIAIVLLLSSSTAYADYTVFDQGNTPRCSAYATATYLSTIYR